MNLARPLFYLAFSSILLLSGCATWSQHGVALSPEQKFRIAVLPITSTAEIKKLKDIESLSAPLPDSSNEKEIIQARVRAATERMTRLFDGYLNASPYFDVASSLQVQEALTASAPAYPGVPLTLEQTKALGQALDVDALLVIELSSYGQIKRKWLVYLIGSGVVEGIIQGVVVGGATKNAWVGTAVFLEEVLQEALVWGGGAYLFDMYYSPVTLEGKLVSTTDGKTIWSVTAFVSVDRKALKKIPEEERKKKEVQLRLTAEKAANDLLKGLKTSAKHNWRLNVQNPAEDPPASNPIFPENR